MNMNKYRLRWVKAYEEIEAVMENIIYVRLYWPKSQILSDYALMDFESDENFDDDELMIFSGYNEYGRPYAYVSQKALSALYEYERYHNSWPFPVMTIDGLHYKKSVMSDNPYELTIMCDALWKGEVFEVPATVDYQGKEYTVTGIDVGQSKKLKNLCELRIPPTVRHIFPEACSGITSLRKVNIPDYCHVYKYAFAECGIEELILGEHVNLEEQCFSGICAKQVNIPDTTKFAQYSREAYECDSYYDLSPVDAEEMDEFISCIFLYSIWDLMELLKKARKGDKMRVAELASYMSSRIPAYQKEPHKYPFSPDEILNLMDENEKLWISQFEEECSRIANMPVSDDDLPF